MKIYSDTYNYVEDFATFIEPYETIFCPLIGYNNLGRITILKHLNYNVYLFSGAFASIGLNPLGEYIYYNFDLSGKIGGSIRIEF